MRYLFNVYHLFLDQFHWNLIWVAQFNSTFLQQLDEVLSRFFELLFFFLNDGYEEKNIKRSSLEAKNVFFLLSSHYSTWKEVSDAEYDHKVAIQP